MLTSSVRRIYLESLKTDPSLVSLFGNALDFSKDMQENLNSFHFLLSCFVSPSEVAVLLEDLSIEPETIASGYKDLKKKHIKNGKHLEEPKGTITAIEKKALTFLQSQDDIPSALHFLCAITNVRESVACQILLHLDILTNVRMQAYSMLSTPAKRTKARMGQMKAESIQIIRTQGENFYNNEAEPQQKQIKNISPTVVVHPEIESSTKPELIPGIKISPENFILPEIFNLFGRNLTELAFAEKIEPIFGRIDEIENILDILCRKKNNNPCIVGPAGSGKTALVEGIAHRQRSGILQNMIIWELNLTSLVSGTDYRGSLEKRVSELMSEVEKLKDKIIVFIDEIHMLATESNEIIANMLKPALSRGNFPLIGATTPDEFKKTIAKDPALERRFSIVNISEPSGEELAGIVLNSARILSTYHKTKLDDENLLKDAIKLSSRYISGKSQPDKVISLLDSLGSVLSRNKKSYASNEDLLKLVSTRTNIPVENLLVDGSTILRNLPEKINRIVKGQNKAKKKICQLLARRFNRKNDEKPIASFIFAGPTGVGKTEMAKRLAEFFFGSEKKLVVFDMSEYHEPHSISRLIGAPPGYAGYEDGGKLTEAFRREPYQLLLLDEIDKSHPKVLNILLQILEEGRIADSRGFSANMSESIVVMTTNIGADEFVTSRVGFGGTNEKEEVRENLIINKIENFLSPEIVNRVDDIVIFYPFNDDEMKEITISMIGSNMKNLEESYSVKLSIEDIKTVADFLVNSMTMKEKSQGARAIQRIVEKNIEGMVLDHIYSSSVYIKQPFILYFNSEKKVLSFKQ